MWPFPRRAQVPPKAIAPLIDEIHGLTQRVMRLEEDLSALTGAHERLRGRFYSQKGSDQPAKALSKAEILANFQRGK